ncbi:MAG TPA: SIS domain-containing protein, partial [Anaerolineae bacterium]|nr:SIS domain-containing protein [Anaerolineae bacterium]
HHLADGWAAARALDLPASFAAIDRIVSVGQGAAAISGGLFAALLAPESPLPITVVRDDELPAFVHGANTLVIASSTSGDTVGDAAETLAAFDQAHARGCQLLALTGGGALAERARLDQAALMLLNDMSPARDAIGWSLAALLQIASRLQWSHDFTADLVEAIEITQAWSRDLAAASPVAQNLAKREAGQLVDRFVVVHGAGHFVEVARHWQQRLNVSAKAWAAVEAIPDANHHTLSGVDFPADFSHQVMALFLTGASDRPRHAQRLVLTQRAFMLSGCNTDILRARGRSPLAQVMSLVTLGECLSTYLALLYGVDPAHVDALISFQNDLADE